MDGGKEPKDNRLLGDPSAAPPDFSSPSWSSALGPESSDSVYFFGDDRESSILSEFGWSLHEPPPPLPSRPAELIAAGADTAGTFAEPTAMAESTSGVTPSNYNPSVSSDSSEDHPEKSTGSGGNPPPAETPGGTARKKGQKRIRQPRFAFMTKSEVDHLEDGYRWRKYGQKAVKNSPFPRSYYRCTNSKCTVKKRVERSSEDPTVVITTYEGQHCHHSVGFPRGAIGLITPNEAAGTAFSGHLAPPILAPQLFNHPQRTLNLSPSPRESIMNSPSRSAELPPRPMPPASSSGPESRQQLPPHSSSDDRSQSQKSEGLTDTTNDRPNTNEGLLGDIVRHR